MEIEIQQLSSLAHEKRLAIFRLLMRRYPQAVPAGEISAAIDARANTASAYLANLRQAGLIEQERSGTSLRYRVSMAPTRALMEFLVHDCCKTRADLCFGLSADTPGHVNQETPLKVLFVCTANSARSIIAETVLNARAEGRFTAFSAGTSPIGAPQPAVLTLLKDNGHDVSELRTKGTDTFTSHTAPELDFVFTVCDDAANDDGPVWPGNPLCAHWGVHDPITRHGEVYDKRALQQTYEDLRARIEAFCALNLETLSPVKLQHALDDIGRSDAVTA